MDIEKLVNFNGHEHEVTVRIITDRLSDKLFTLSKNYHLGNRPSCKKELEKIIEELSILNNVLSKPTNYEVFIEPELDNNYDQYKYSFVQKED